MATFCAGECDIHNLCVSPSAQKQGVGKLLLVCLIKQARRQHMDEIFLEVRASNTVAHHLYEAFGFHQYGCRKQYYQGVEDAYLFKRDARLK